MSWIVSTLLRSSLEIKSNPSIDSDDYNDLLVIERKIEELYRNGLLSNDELELLEHVSDGKPLNQVGTEINKSRLTMARKFYAISNRIAQSLGGQFTDDGYIYYMQRKYNLTEEQIDIIRKYMESRFKYKIMRKII